MSVGMSIQNPAPPATVQAFHKATQDLLHAAQQLSETKDAAAITKGLQELDSTHTQAQNALKAKN